MSYVKGIDISHWQNDKAVINFQAVRDSGVEIGICKISGGDAGLYYDKKATVNYYGLKGAGIAVGGYHFAGGGDARNEAEYFVNGMRPFAQDDVFVLDWEIKHADPVGWCTTFVNRVHELTGVWPLLYVNGSTFNAYNWSPVTANCGVWVAWYGRDPEGTLPVGGKRYVMHQYTSSGSVPGITGAVDLDAWFGTVAQFKKYGYQAPAAPAPAPTPTPQPEPTPTPEPVVTPPVVVNDPVVPVPVETPEPETSPEPQEGAQEPSKEETGTDTKDEDKSGLQGFKKAVLAFFAAIAKFLKS